MQEFEREPGTVIECQSGYCSIHIQPMLQVAPDVLQDLEDCRSLRVTRARAGTFRSIDMMVWGSMAKRVTIWILGCWRSI